MGLGTTNFNMVAYVSFVIDSFSQVLTSTGKELIYLLIVFFLLEFIFLLQPNYIIIFCKSKLKSMVSLCW